MGSNPIRTSHSLTEPVAAGVLLGGGAGALAALADLASTFFWLAPGPDRYRLAFTLVALGLCAGALVGATAALAHALLARRVANPLARHALVVALPLLPVAHWLFHGGRMRRLPAQVVLQPVAAVALIAGAALLLTHGTAAVTALRARARGQRLAAGAGCFVAALALHALDHRLLPRLYEYLHAGLGVLTALTLAAALALAGPRPRRPGGAALVTASVALLAGALAWSRLEVWANVHAEVYGAHAPFVRHAVRALAALTGGREARAPDPLALRRARYNRQRAADTARARAPADPSLPLARGAHVLLVTIDAMRADRLGRVVDGRSLTPTLDALAARGVVFERAYTQAPHSSYSLSSLHTGEYLHETIPLGQAQPLPTLAVTLRAAGYHTAALYTRGIFFTEGERLTVYRDADYGFVRAAHVDHFAREQAAAAMAEIDDLVRRGEPPGFLWVHFFDAHAPYQGRGATPEAQYDAAVRAIDAALGTVLDHARRALARDVVVAVTADHGEEFGEHGGVYHGSTLYEEQVRVPMVIAAPGLAPRRVTAPVELVDLAPTLAALVGAGPAASMRGRDLRPRMVRDEPDAPVFAAVNSRKMVVRWPYKLIADLTYGVDELYDLDRDPHERRNLADDEGPLRAELHAEISAWLEALARSAGGATALARARLGDRGAAPDLAALALDRRLPPPERIEAIELLAGFADPALVPVLRPLLAERDPAVASAAAVVLGAAGDASARDRLLDLLAGDPRPLRRAAAFALARLGDARAIEGLAEALWTPDETTVLDAIRALGALGAQGHAAVLEPLLAILPEDHVRYRVALALGQTRDPRVFPVLAEIARRDPADDARANAAAALGMLGDRRAVPLLVASITRDRATSYAAEALGVLGAIGREVDGFDARGLRGVPPAGFVSCGPHDDRLGWRYLGASSCLTAGARASVRFHSGGAGPRLLVLRLRRGDDGPAVPLVLRLDGREVARATVAARWEEPRIVLDAVPAGDVVLDLQLLGVAGDSPTLRLDHVLALPLR